MLMGAMMPVIDLVISSNQDIGYNVKTAAGTVTVASIVNVTVSEGYRVKKMTTGTFPSGSKLNIINNGVIFGPGGAGGNGGNATDNDGHTGYAGDHAIVLTTSSGFASIVIDNTNGYVLGGGGGGAGGAAMHFPLPVDEEAGGGGGGGAGGAFGGYGGNDTVSTTTSAVDGDTGRTPTWSGSSWSRVGTGNGGSGRAGAIGTFGSPPCYGQYGNNGGNWGADGLSRDVPNTHFYTDTTPSHNVAGGAAGKAVQLNGNVTPTWTGGDNSTQKKGAVS